MIDNELLIGAAQSNKVLSIIPLIKRIVRNFQNVSTKLLVYPDIDKNIAYFDLVSRISEALTLPEEKIDILFFDLQEADPDILPKTGLFVQTRIRKTEEHGA